VTHDATVANRAARRLLLSSGRILDDFESALGKCA
jgi:predicted ABC-type transport system involved in lysophospholipase L1 biosynthesis ATPase subunit